MLIIIEQQLAGNQ